MDYIVFFGAFAVFALVIFVRGSILESREKRKIKEKLYHEFGSLPVKKYGNERIAHIDTYFKKHKEDNQIDDITWNDLSMNDIFIMMNHTYSATGEEYLYHTLRSVGKSKEELEQLEERIQFFDDNEDIRVATQLYMMELGYTGKFSIYDYIGNLYYLGERSNKKDILLDIMFLPLILLLAINTPIAIILIVALLIYNIISYYGQKGIVDPYLISFQYIYKLLHIGEKIGKLNLKGCLEEEKTIHAKLHLLKPMMSGSIWFNNGYRSATGGNPLEIIMDYIRMAFHVDLIWFNKTLHFVRKYEKDLDELITALGKLEVSIAILAFRKSLQQGYCVPVFADENEKCLEMINAYHPLINNPVKNSVKAKKGVLITGSNASGKSTFLKMVAINTILAQTIHTCAADSYKAPLFRIYSSMALRDDLCLGESYYIVEIKSIKRILEEGKKASVRPILCFVDEVLRGTNTIERIAASTRILSEFQKGNMLCFAATHDLELACLLKEDFENYHFEEEISDDDIQFPYVLKKGSTKTRNAIKLLRIMGYPQSIVEKAEEMAEYFVSKGKWQENLDVE